MKVFDAIYRQVAREPEGHFFMTEYLMEVMRSRILDAVHGYGPDVVNRVNKEFDLVEFCCVRKLGRTWYRNLYIPM